MAKTYASKAFCLGRVQHMGFENPVLFSFSSSAFNLLSRPLRLNVINAQAGSLPGIEFERANSSRSIMIYLDKE